MNNAIYCRVSKEESDWKTQLNIIRQYLDRTNKQYCPNYTYIDICTGVHSKRPAYQKLLKDMREYQFDTIIVTKIDRIGRSLQNFLCFIQEAKNLGVRFVAVTQNIDTGENGKDMTPTQMFTMQLLGIIAEYEANLISERTKEALKHNPATGKRGPDKRPRRKRGYYAKRKGI